MFTDWLRKASRSVVEPLVTVLVRLRIHANTLTIVGCLASCAVGVVLALGHLRLGGVLLIAASGFDALDGSVARRLNRPTRFGAFLDSVLDRISEAAVLIGLAWWYMGQPGRVPEILVYITLLGSTMVSYTRARAEGLGIECRLGMFSRIERCIAIIAGLILNLMIPVLWVLAVGTMATTVQRVFHVYRQTKDEPQASL